jgi:hypothetical protein
MLVTSYSKYKVGFINNTSKVKMQKERTLVRAQITTPLLRAGFRKENYDLNSYVDFIQSHSSELSRIINHAILKGKNATVKERVSRA